MQTTSINLHNPYVGARSFRKGEQLYGRELEVMDLLDLLVAERMVLMFSPSGAGKTSLIEARLIPELEKTRFKVLPTIRVNQEPPADYEQYGERFNRYTFSALVSLERNRPAEQRIALSELATLTLSEYLARTSSKEERESRVLIFDQFEEVLTASVTDQAAKHAFFSQLGDALGDRRVWALFSMREDYVGSLTPYLRHIPNRLRRTFRLDLLKDDAARLAIQEPARKMGVEFNDEAASHLVDDLRKVQVQLADGTINKQAGPYIEPVQLQVVCLRLWNSWKAAREQAAEQDGLAITKKDVEGLGNIDNALADYYSDSAADVARRYSEEANNGAIKSEVIERAIRRWFDSKLITKDGIRAQVLQEDEESEGLDNKIIRLIIATHLVRAEPRGGRVWFELAHDRLIRPVRNNNKEWFEANLSVLQRRAEVWDQERRSDALLLRDSELKDADEWAAAHTLTDTERDFLKESHEAQDQRERDRRRVRYIRGLAVVSLILLVFASVMFLRAEGQRKGAERERKRAEESGERSRQLLYAADVNLAHQAYHANNIEQARSLLDTHLPELEQGDLGFEWYYLWRLLHGELVTLRGHTEAVFAVAFSPDGKTLATAGGDKTVKLWDAESHKELATLTGHDYTITSVAFSPDGRLLATGSVPPDGSSGETMKLWDVSSRQAIATISAGEVTTLVFSPDGRMLATAYSYGNVIKLWDVQGLITNSPKELATLKGHGIGVASVNFLPDGRLVSTDRDRTMRFWNGSTYRQIKKVNLAENYLSIAISPDGRILVGADDQGNFDVCDVLKPVKKSIKIPNMHNQMVVSIAFSPDSNMFATASLDSTIKLWPIPGVLRGKPSSFIEIGTYKGHTLGLSAIAFSPDGKTLASGSYDSTVKLWGVRANEAEMTLEGIEDTTSLALSPDGRMLADIDGYGRPTLWDTKTRKKIPTREEFAKAASTVALSPDGRVLAIGGIDRVVKLWDVESQKEIPAQLTGHKDEIYAIEFSPDAKVLASVDAEMVKLWDTSSWAEINTLPIGGITTIAFSPNEKVLAVANHIISTNAGTNPGSDFSVRLFNYVTGEQIGSLTGHTAIITRVAFSPDGRMIATASEDKTARLWDVSTRAPVFTFTGHTESVRTLAISPDGRTLATGDLSGMVRLWDIRTHRELLTLVKSTDWDGVTWLGFSRDGKTLAAGSGRGEIKLWLAATREEVLSRSP